VNPSDALNFFGSPEPQRSQGSPPGSLLSLTLY
jgi:hypothetical protein